MHQAHTYDIQATTRHQCSLRTFIFFLHIATFILVWREKKCCFRLVYHVPFRQLNQNGLFNRKSDEKIFP